MSKPLQPGQKFAISTTQADALAVAWLNSQRNRSKAVMDLIREAAKRAMNVSPVAGPTSPRQPPAPQASAIARRRMAPDPVESDEGFSGMADFLSGIDQLGKPKV